MCRKLGGHSPQDTDTIKYYVDKKKSPGDSDSKESACFAEDLGCIPGLGRSAGAGHGNPLHYSCLENPHGQRGLVGDSPWGHRVYGVTELDTTEQLGTAQQEKAQRYSFMVLYEDEMVEWHHQLNGHEFE